MGKLWLHAQGQPPPCERTETEHTETPHEASGSASPSAALKPITASPHPLIPGHKWPEKGVLSCGELRFFSAGTVLRFGLCMRCHHRVFDTACDLSDIVNVLAYQEAKTSPRVIRNTPYGLQCPFAVDSDDHCSHGTEYRAHQLAHEERIWNAAAKKDSTADRTGKCSTTSRLIPSDCMWFDSGSQRTLETFPARQYLGRYRS